MSQTGIRTRIKMDRFGRVQGTTFEKRGSCRGVERAPTSALEFLTPPFGQVIEIGISLKADVVAATVGIYRDATPVTEDGTPLTGSDCFPLVSTTSLTGGAGVTFHWIAYTHNGGGLAIKVTALTDNNTPDLAEPVIIAYRWC